MTRHEAGIQATATAGAPSDISITVDHLVTNGLKALADVVCAITPVTNPTSTTVFKALMTLKSRSPIVFAAPGVCRDDRFTDKGRTALA